jgi:hypothetical protein
VLYIDVAKVDRDVAHVVMPIYVCFKCMFQMFHLLLMNVASVFVSMLHIHAYCNHMFQALSDVSYVCFQMFHLDVVYICNGFQMFFSCFRKCFICLFQVFHMSSSFML